mgnify:CR=1 FL=1
MNRILAFLLVVSLAASVLSLDCGAGEYLGWLRVASQDAPNDQYCRIRGGWGAMRISLIYLSTCEDNAGLRDMISFHFFFFVRYLSFILIEAMNCSFVVSNTSFCPLIHPSFCCHSPLFILWYLDMIVISLVWKNITGLPYDPPNKASTIWYASSSCIWTWPNT